MRYAQPAPRRSSRRVIPTIFVSILGVLALAVAGLAVYAKVTNRNLYSTTSQLFVPPPEKVFGKDRILMLILGIDYDYDAKDQESSKNARSDTIMVAALDFPTKTFRIVSVPRDMDYINKQGQDDKINGAYTEGGYLGSDAAVGKFLNLPRNANHRYFDRHVVLRINATKDLIDAIGGIDVPVTEKLDYDDSWGHLHIHFKPGMTHMNGDQAVSYSRFRHDACSDPCRIKRQQQVVKIMVQKLKSNKFNDITHIGELIGVVQKNVITDLKPNEMTSLAVGFADTPTNDLKMTQIPYVADKDTPNGNVVIPDQAQLPQIVATNLTGPFAVASPVPSAEIAKIAPASVRVDVRNGSGTAGVANKMAADLKARGFTVASVGNADSYDHATTEIHAHSKLPGAGELLREKLKLPSATVVTDDPSPAASPAPAASDVTVIVGKDYAASLLKTTALVP
jgi:LCP family protein required for cell wall assembly